MRKIILAIAMFSSGLAVAEEAKMSFSASMCINNYVRGDESKHKALMHHCKASAQKESNIISQAVLGDLYLNGSKGFEQDDESARYWFSMAAKGNHGPSMAELGRLYMLGRGGEKNYEKAEFYLNEAIKQQSGKAAFYRSAMEGLKMSDGIKIPLNDMMLSICKNNLIAMDYGYEKSQAAFQAFVSKSTQVNPVYANEILDRCRTEVRKHHAENTPIILYSRAGMPVEQNKIPDGPFPVHSPQFWMQLFPKK